MGIRPVSHSSEKINRLFEVSELLYKYWQLYSYRASEVKKAEIAQDQ